jgi:hypothetical protein
MSAIDAVAKIIELNVRPCRNPDASIMLPPKGFPKDAEPLLGLSETRTIDVERW